MDAASEDARMTNILSALLFPFQRRLSAWRAQNHLQAPCERHSQFGPATARACLANPLWPTHRTKNSLSCLMPEVPESREDHCQSQPVSGFDHFLIAH